MVAPLVHRGSAQRPVPSERVPPAASAGVLVVQPDARVRANLQAAFRAHGYRVTSVGTGAQALVEAADYDVEAVLLDIQLPDVDGVEFCRTLRTARPDLVILVLAEDREDQEVIDGLDAGADDYLAAPVGLVALVARVRVRLTRRPVADRPPRPLRVGQLALDPRSRRCTVSGEPVELRLKHFDLLELMVRAAGRTVRREELIQQVWGEVRPGSSKTLDVHVASLRHRVAQAALRAGDRALAPSIRTVRGIGYQLEELTQPASGAR